MSVKVARKGANFGAFGGLRGAPSCNSPTRLTGGIPRREAPPECPSWRGGGTTLYIRFEILSVYSRFTPGSKSRLGLHGRRVMNQLDERLRDTCTKQSQNRRSAPKGYKMWSWAGRCQFRF